MRTTLAILGQLNPELRKQAEEKLKALPRRTHRHPGAGVQAKPKRRYGLLPKVASEPEERLAFQLRAEGIEHEREFAFCKERRYRADFFIRAGRLLVEVNGGLWSRGRHTRADGYEKDRIKMNEAEILGYRALEFTPEMVSSGHAVHTIKRALGLTNDRRGRFARTDDGDQRRREEGARARGRALEAKA